MYQEPLRNPFALQADAMFRRLRARVTEWHSRQAGERTVPKSAPADAADRRREALGALNALSREISPTSTRYHRVLADGMWENANYWTRYALFRAALGLVYAEETGLLGAYNRAAAEEVFSTFGFAGRADYVEVRRRIGDKRTEAQRILRNVSSADDMLGLEFPYGLPAEIVYDGILKRQRRGMVDVTDPLLVDYVAEALQCLEAAHRLFEEGHYDLVTLSHALNFEFGSIAWCSIRAGAEVVILYGDFGTSRFQRIHGRDDMLKYLNCPTPEEVATLDDEERQRRVMAGSLYMDNRLRGTSGDISALYAYQRPQGMVTRNDIVQIFGWDADKPIVCVFASNWFDFPHSSNMNNFRDFRDWIDATIEACVANENINWLFKPHPCDTWYGAVNGPTVTDLVAAAARSNLQIVDETWNGYSLMRAIDAGVTYFGTIGIELPAIGKPVLVADEAWYAPHDFVVRPYTRDGYLAALGRNWWEGFDREVAARRAKEFTGWFFCDAAWHGGFHFRDDSEQYLIYAGLQTFLSDNYAAVKREVEMIFEWMASDHPYYHTYKMLCSRVGISDKKVLPHNLRK